MSLCACTLGFLVGSLSLVHGTIRIADCNEHGWLDIREDITDTPYMKCDGFDGHQTVNWRIVINNAVVASATCGPLPTMPFSRCSESTSDIAVHRRSNTSSYLFFRGDRRELAGNATVECYLHDNTAASTCRTNVFSPAVLSDCEVTMTTHRTLAGTCHFNNAYSSNGTYTCTWTLTPLDRQGSPDLIISGKILKTEQTSDDKLYYRGTCFFVRRTPGGQYNYTVRFFPGKPEPQYQGSVDVPESPTTTPLSSSTERTARAEADHSSFTDSVGMVATVVVIVVVVVIVAVVVAVRSNLGKYLRDCLRLLLGQRPKEKSDTFLTVPQTVRQQPSSTSDVQGENPLRRRGRRRQQLKEMFRTFFRLPGTVRQQPPSTTYVEDNENTDQDSALGVQLN